MSLRIYNSLSRVKEDFTPLKAGEVSMYVCGPTVYDEPHIGHARSAYVFDVVRRYLIHRGYRVRFVRNVTDVDDKIIDRARTEYPGQELNAAVRRVASQYLARYHDALQALEIGKDAAIGEPKASEYIPQMVIFIQRLIERGAAYQSGGDVYFDITTARDYGKLSHQDLKNMEAGARIAPNEKKKHPLDFALWKAAKEDEPSWASPWGKGRPGWHIECSVMSSNILGGEFDIHGGGIDLIFPHHENEIAQSEGAGERFARAWVHHGLLTINGQKMSKSLGNFVTVTDFLKKHSDPDLLKLLFLSAHYSHPVDYTEKKIEEAKQAHERIAIFLARCGQTLVGPGGVSGGPPHDIGTAEERFHAAMDDDFNTPQALAALFDLVSAGNKHSDEAPFLQHARELLHRLLNVLGLCFSGMAVSLEENIQKLIDERDAARRCKDFARSDVIRRQLDDLGIIVEDTKDGTTWRKKA